MSNLVPFQELESMASYIARSKLFGAKDESQAMALMLVAQAEGLHPMTAVQDFDIVQGRPARKTHSILARFQAAGGSVEWEEITPLRAVGTFKHKQGGSLRVEWTFEQAKKAGLTGKDNWKNYPQAMLRARCIAEGVRAVFPGAIGGMLTVEEAHDLSPTPGRSTAQVVGSEVVGMLDINEPPTPAQPAEVKKHPMGEKAFTRALAAIKAKQFTLDEIEATYELTPEQREQAVALEVA